MKDDTSLSTQQKSWKEGLLAGVVTVCCGVTVSFFAPSAGTSGALAGSALGASLYTVLRNKQQTQEISQSVSNNSSHNSSNNSFHNYDLLPSQIHNPASDVPQIEEAKFKIQPTSLNGNHPRLPAKLPTEVEEIITILHNRGVTVERFHQRVEKDNLYDEIALFLGENYYVLEPLYKEIKRKLNGVNGFSFPVSTSQKQRDTIIKFSRLLRENSIWLCDYKNQEKKIFFSSGGITGENNGFLTGGWLERYLLYQVATLFSAFKIKYQYLTKSNCIYSHGENFELDILFLVNNELIFIEAKTGEILNEDLTKCSNHRRRLGLTKSRTILCGLSLDDDAVTRWNQIQDISVSNLNSFMSRISAALSLPNNLENIQSNISSHGELYTLLKNKSLRPSPEQRHVVIQEIINLFQNKLDPEITLADIERKIADNYRNTEISKSKIHDILNAVLRSQSLVSETGEIIFKFNDPLSKLLYLDVSILEQKCVESYTTAILTMDNNFFNSPIQIAWFKQIVGADIPDNDVIQRLKVEAKLLASEMIQN
jgi:hypothetical protein